MSSMRYFGLMLDQQKKKPFEALIKDIRAAQEHQEQTLLKILAHEAQLQALEYENRRNNQKALLAKGKRAAATVNSTSNPPPTYNTSRGKLTNPNQNNPIQPDSGMDKPKFWTALEVVKWLNALNYGEYADKFAENEIDGQALLAMDHDTLKEFGMVQVRPRLLLLEKIQELKKQ